jgi:hypothetical protein
MAKVRLFDAGVFVSALICGSLIERICASRQDVGEWSVGGAVFRWREKTSSYPWKDAEKGIFPSFISCTILTTLIIF